MRRLIAIAAVTLLLVVGTVTLPAADPEHGIAPIAAAEAHGAKYPWMWAKCRVVQNGFIEEHLEINVSTSATRKHKAASMLSCVPCLGVSGCRVVKKF